MTSRQTVLGHCLLSPFSQGQEKKEKLFFRRNSEILCQLFNAKTTTTGNRRRPMSDIGPIRHIRPNYDVINIPSARHVITSCSGSPHPSLDDDYPNDVTTRPHTTSPVSTRQRLSAKQLFRSSQPFLADSIIHFTQPDVVQRQHSGRHGDIVNKTSKKSKSRNRQNRSSTSSSLSKAKNNKKTTTAKTADTEIEKRRIDDDDDDNDLHGDNEDESRGASPSRHDMLIQSHRHPRSIQCDTLGPAACKYCIRRASLSDASFILPSTGVFSNRLTTVRLPPGASPKEYQMRVPSVQSSTSNYTPALEVTPERHTPISVFLRTRKKKGKELEKDQEKDKKSVKFSATDTEIVLRKERTRDEIQEVADANVDDNNGDDDGDGDDGQSGNDEDKDLEDVSFDGLKVSVTFREKDRDESKDLLHPDPNGQVT